MSLSKLSKAFDIIENNKHLASFVGKINVEVIALAEKKLGLKFPPTYSAFLETYGAGGIFGMEIYGIIDADFENSGIPDAIWLTIKNRKESRLPEDLILICSSDDGAYFAIDCSQETLSNENPIVVWEPGEVYPNHEFELISNDFGEFLYEGLLDGVKYKDLFEKNLK